MSSSRRIRQSRSRLSIINDILSVANQGSRKTHIMYGANLSYDQLTGYIGFLVDNGLIVKVDDPDYEGSFIFRATDKGKEFLKTYSKMREVLPGKKTERSHNTEKTFL